MSYSGCPPMPFTIEFLGIPGSGKTTLTDRVRQDIVATGAAAMTLTGAVSHAVGEGVGDRLTDPVMSLVPRKLIGRVSEAGFLRSRAYLLSLVDFMVAHPASVSAYMNGLERRAPFEVGRELVVTWFLQLIARYQLAAGAMTADEILLLDEGFCQRVVTGFGHQFSEADHRDVTRYLASVPPPDLLVYLAPDVTEVSRRLEKYFTPEVGGKSPITNRLDYTEIDPREFLADTAHCVSYVARQARESGWSVVEVGATVPVTTAAEVVIERLGVILESVQSEA